MNYKVVKNVVHENDCDCCVFKDACVDICPLEIGFYFSDINSLEPDYMSAQNKGLFKII